MVDYTKKNKQKYCDNNKEKEKNQEVRGKKLINHYKCEQQLLSCTSGCMWLADWTQTTCSMFTSSNQLMALQHWTDLQRIGKVFVHIHAYIVNTCNVASGVPRLAITELREHSISVCVISMNCTSPLQTGGMSRRQQQHSTVFHYSRNLYIIKQMASLQTNTALLSEGEGVSTHKTLKPAPQQTTEAGPGKMGSAALPGLIFTDPATVLSIYVHSKRQLRGSIYDAVFIYKVALSRFNMHTISIALRLTWRWIQKVFCMSSIKGLNTFDQKKNRHSVQTFHTSH